MTDYAHRQMIIKMFGWRNHFYETSIIQIQELGKKYQVFRMLFSNIYRKFSVCRLFGPVILFLLYNSIWLAAPAGAAAIKMYMKDVYNVPSIWFRKSTLRNVFSERVKEIWREVYAGIFATNLFITSKIWRNSLLIK